MHSDSGMKSEAPAVNDSTADWDRSGLTLANSGETEIRPPRAIMKKASVRVVNMETILS